MIKKIISDKLHAAYIEEFKNKIIALSKEYNLSISHEDSEGSFIITPYDEDQNNWFTDAYYKHNKDKNE